MPISPAARARPARRGDHGGSFDFLESALLADIYGSALAATAACHRLLLDAASAWLATNVQRALDAQVEPDGRNPWRVAGRWLRAHGLISEGGVVLE